MYSLFLHCSLVSLPSCHPSLFSSLSFQNFFLILLVKKIPCWTMLMEFIFMLTISKTYVENIFFFFSCTMIKLLSFQGMRRSDELDEQSVHSPGACTRLTFLLNIPDMGMFFSYYIALALDSTSSCCTHWFSSNFQENYCLLPTVREHWKVACGQTH